MSSPDGWRKGIIGLNLFVSGVRMMLWSETDEASDVGRCLDLHSRLKERRNTLFVCSVTLGAPRLPRSLSLPIPSPPGLAIRDISVSGLRDPGSSRCTMGDAGTWECCAEQGEGMRSSKPMNGVLVGR